MSTREDARKVALTMVLSTTPQVVNALSSLLETGLFGRTISEVAEGLLREKLRELTAPIRSKLRARIDGIVHDDFEPIRQRKP